MMSGQMGQPAACMIDSNSLSTGNRAGGDYGPRKTHGPAHSCPPALGHPRRGPPTISVDNFVGKPLQSAPKPAPGRASVTMMKIYAAKNTYKSMGCTYFRALRGGWAALQFAAAERAALWSSACSGPGTPVCSHGRGAA
jgi:hypothetical protein